MSVQAQYSPGAVPGNQEAVARGILSQDKGTIFAPVALGRSRRLTPEGFLVCEDVAVCRTGEMVYRANELPFLQPGKDGLIIVTRTPDVVFDPTHLASLEGKSVTWRHPPKDVGPDNYKQYEFGTLQNLHRGKGIEDDLLLADLLIKDRECINYANAHKPELSEGYKSDYQQTSPGRANQLNLIGNHVALVENGRAGPRISIKDSLPAEGIIFMSDKNFLAKIIGRLVARGVTAQDAEAVAREIQADAPAPIVINTTDSGSAASGNMTDALSNFEKRVQAMIEPLTTKINAIETRDAQRTKDEAEEEERKKKETKDAEEAEALAKKKKEEEEGKTTGDMVLEAETVGHVINLGKVYTGDAAPLVQINARAEILSPGIQVPTADSLKPNKDGTQMRDHMRRVLTESLKGKNAKSVQTFLAGRTVDSLSGMNLVTAYNGAAELARLSNTASTTSAAGISRQMRTGDTGNKRKTAAEINEVNRKYREDVSKRSQIHG